MTHPVGRSNSTPIPWLSALLVVAFVGFSVHARLRTEAALREGVGALDAAREYFVAHPYLEPGSALSTRLDEETVQRARADFAQRLAASSLVPTPPGVIRRQQAELDQMIERALVSVGELPAQRVAFVPRSSPGHTWLAYPLLHLGNAVLIGNGLLLLFFGLYLERSFGAAVYAAVVVWLVLAGAAGWAATAPSGATHGLVGSTPLVAGLAAAFAARYVNRRAEGFYGAGLAVSALWILLPPYATAAWSFAGLELLPTQAAPAPTAIYVPCLASVAAAAIACTAAWLIGIEGESTRGSVVQARDPRLRRALRARAAGRPREALELLAQHLAAEPDHYEAALASWEVARELGRDAEITASLLRVIRIELRRGLSAAAIDHWLDLERDGVPERTDPALLLQLAILLREHGHQPEAVRALRCALERSEDRENHVIAARIARAARGLDPGTTETAAWRALGSAELSLAERQALEDLIAEVLATPAARAASLARIAAKPAAAVSSAPTPAPAAIEIETSNRVLDAVLAVPLELAAEGVEIQTSQGQKKLVRYERVEAVSVAAVHGIAAKPVILVDLVLNWMTPKHETLRVIRMRGDQFDPRRLLENLASPTDALRAFVKTVLERSNAIPLPDADAALGRPFSSFEELAIYQRAVLFVEGPAR